MVLYNTVYKYYTYITRKKYLYLYQEKNLSVTINIKQSTTPTTTIYKKVLQWAWYVLGKLDTE